MSHAKLIVPAVVVVLILMSSTAPAAHDRSYVAQQSNLILDGANCGFLKSVDGGVISAEVIQEPAGPAQFVKKHIGQPKYGEFILQTGFANAPALYEWIQQSWAMKSTQKSGCLVALDFDMTPKSERQFRDALLTETTIPAMDGSSKEPAYLTIKFAPELIRVTSPTTKFEPPAPTPSQKQCLACNFRLEIDGIDCTKVSRVESFTVKQATVTDDIGDARDYAKEPGKLEFPNLKITLAEAAAQPFAAWHEDFVVKGNNDESKEKAGSLSLLSPDRAKTLAKIKFYNLGIFRMTPVKSEAGSDSIARVEVELYVERMEFLMGEAAEATTPPQAPTAPRIIRRG
ncbi:MAG: phage tail protein [Phycisphaerales bacterium]